jgi:hypothetical protein
MKSSFRLKPKFKSSLSIILIKKKEKCFGICLSFGNSIFPDMQQEREKLWTASAEVG